MPRHRLFLTLAAAAALSASVLAAEKGQRVFLDPAQAGRDYALQGEYAGAVKTDQGEAQVGVQVIALGDGKFQAVGYKGGLPGAGWDKSDRVKSEASVSDGVVRFTSPDGAVTATLTPSEIVLKAGDKRIGALKKVERKSPTLGQKAPDGAIVLFDGGSADKFTPGKTDGGLLTQGNNSKQKFQSFKAHVEFRTQIGRAHV